MKVKHVASKRADKNYKNEDFVHILVFVDTIVTTVAAPIFLSTKTFEKRYENGS